ncbi:34735_t:CDS:2, partial [Gigaspora margarita]
TPSSIVPSAPSGVTSFASLNVTSSALSGAMFTTTPCATTPLVLTSVSLTPDEKRNYLFDVNGSYKHINGDIQKVFTCRFTKHRSREKENIPNEKRRLTKTWPSGLCHAKIE